MFNPNLSYVFWRFSLETNTTTPDLSKQNPSLSHGCHANGQTGLSRIFFFFFFFPIHAYIHTYECVIIGYCLPVSSTWIVCVRVCAYVCANSILYPFRHVQIKYLFNQLDYHHCRRRRMNLIRCFWPEKRKLYNSAASGTLDVPNDIMITKNRNGSGRKKKCFKK